MTRGVTNAPPAATRRSAAAGRPRVGVSSCLLGEAVRWNGSDKQDRNVTEVLGRLFEWVPLCPEVEIGLGVPREPIRLEGDPAFPRLVGRTSGIDLTERMEAFSTERVERIADAGLCGYVFKSASPTCGLEGVEVASASGASRPGTGLFAAEVLRRLPDLPVEEERGLEDPGRRERFIQRVYEVHARRAAGGSGDA